jgi:hypothetical protein
MGAIRDGLIRPIRGEVMACIRSGDPCNQVRLKDIELSLSARCDSVGACNCIWVGANLFSAQYQDCRSVTDAKTLHEYSTPPHVWPAPSDLAEMDLAEE